MSSSTPSYFDRQAVQACVICRSKSTMILTLLPGESVAAAAVEVAEAFMIDRDCRALAEEVFACLVDKRLA